MQAVERAELAPFKMLSGVGISKRGTVEPAPMRLLVRGAGPGAVGGSNWRGWRCCSQLGVCAESSRVT